MGRPSAAILPLVAENEYDGDGVGDGNLTKVTLHPGVGADRVTRMWYDWRGRLVSTADAANVTYSDLDNFGRATKRRVYEPTAAPGSTNGVPRPPGDGTLLRAQSETLYDARGRAYRSRQRDVRQSDGRVGGALESALWFDGRGNVIKSLQPGGLVSKTAYDGANRPTAQYITDGGGDWSWADACGVDGDIVLSQVGTQYDENGNPILLTSGARRPDGGMRISYVAYYYDVGDRLVDVVDVGTNGGASYSRTQTPPERSDALLRVTREYNDAGLVAIVTDPRGNQTRTWYDALGRPTQVIEAYVDGVPSDDDDRTTRYTYDNGMSHKDTITAVLPQGQVQTTEYIYGVSHASGSAVDSYNLLGRIVYPDKTSGQASEATGDRELFTYNALGQQIGATDRNGTEHRFGYDDAGRPTTDRIEHLGAGVDDAVLRLETAFDALDRPVIITSLDAPSGGNVVNQIKRRYNGFGQLAGEYQSHSGAVNTQNTPRVQYGYGSASTGSRLISMTYPNGRVLHYLYNGSALDDAVGRLSAISASGSLNDALERYEYLGLGFVVTRQRPEIGIELTYVKQGGEPNGDGGDQLIGLDRFGRVVDQRWIEGGTATDVDRFQLGYDANGNLKFIDNRSLPQRSQLFNNGGPADRLNRLSAFARGELNGQRDGIVGEPLRTQSWDLDALDNFQSVSTNGAAVSRAHNLQNQVTAVGSATLSYNGNGNAQVDEQGRKLVFDAWNRLVEVKDSEEQTLATYAYDAAGRRIQETHGQRTRELYYSPAWQVIEDREGGDVKAQQVWSAVYVDAMVLRDVDADGSSGTGDLGRPGSGLEQRLYAQTDANFNVTSVVAAQSYLGDDKPTVVRGYVTPQGQPLNNQSAWAVWNGGTWAGNLADGRPFTEEYSSTDVEWKVDGTSMGVWSFADGEWSYESGGTGAYTFAPLAPGPGELMERMEYDPYGQVRFLDWDGEEKLDGQFGWTYLHQGGRYDASAGLYDFRNRQYSPTLGRWMSVDPLGYVDGMNVYGYLGGNPVGAVDPMGTQAVTTVVVPTAAELDAQWGLRPPVVPGRYPSVGSQLAQNGPMLVVGLDQTLYQNVDWYRDSADWFNNTWIMDRFKYYTHTVPDRWLDEHVFRPTDEWMKQYCGTDGTLDYPGLWRRLVGRPQSDNRGEYTCRQQRAFQFLIENSLHNPFEEEFQGRLNAIQTGEAVYVQGQYLRLMPMPDLGFPPPGTTVGSRGGSSGGARPLDLFSSGFSAAETQQMIEYARFTNSWIAGQGGAVTLKSTSGLLRQQASAAAERERRRAEGLGDLRYRGMAVGHVPDTTVTGSPVPPMWMPMTIPANSYIGSKERWRVGRDPVNYYRVDGIKP
jgi:RHS repeat-associated protein